MATDNQQDDQSKEQEAQASTEAKETTAKSTTASKARTATKSAAPGTSARKAAARKPVAKAAAKAAAAYAKEGEGVTGADIKAAPDAARPAEAKAAEPKAAPGDAKTADAKTTAETKAEAKPEARPADAKTEAKPEAAPADARAAEPAAKAAEPAQKAAQAQPQAQKAAEPAAAKAQAKTKEGATVIDAQVQEVAAEIVPNTGKSTGLQVQSGKGMSVIGHEKKLMQRYYKARLKKVHFRDYFTPRFFRNLFRYLIYKWKEMPPRIRFPILIVLLPTFFSLIYFLLIASPMYVSETKFAIKSTSPTGAIDLALPTQMFNMPTSTTQDAMVIEEYLKSVDAFDDIDGVLDVVRHYSGTDHDLVSRLSDAPTVNDRLVFWKGVSTVSVNQDSGVITFEVRAYDPDTAYNIANEALHQSEIIVNGMNERARSDTLELAQTEVTMAENRLQKAQDELESFRAEHKNLDLKATASGMQSLIMELEGQATSIRAQIAENRQYMHEDAPAMRNLNARLEGIQKQIELEKEKLTAQNRSGTSLNTLASTYENLMIEADFANQQLVYAMTSLEKAKLEVMTKNLYLVTVAKPSMPDESLYPQPFLFTLYIFFGLSFFYAILSVVVSAVKEHIGF